MQNGVRNCSCGVAPEREHTGDHFVQQNAKGKQVGARVQGLAHHLFRRHVGYGADSGAGTGEVVPGGRGRR